MNPLSHLCAPTSVPYRHKVSAIAAISPVTLDLNAPANPYAKSSSNDKARTENTSRGRYSAMSAGSGFAAQILVEADMTGIDPFAGMRGAKAYDTRRAPITSVRLVA